VFARYTLPYGLGDQLTGATPEDRARHGQVHDQRPSGRRSSTCHELIWGLAGNASDVSGLLLELGVTYCLPCPWCGSEGLHAQPVSAVGPRHLVLERAQPPGGSLARVGEQIRDSSWCPLPAAYCARLISAS
jgi:hypothetical protein